MGFTRALWRHHLPGLALAICLMLSLAPGVRAGEALPAADAAAEIEAWFFWSRGCPHCIAAHPDVLAIAAARPWLRLHPLEISGEPANLALYERLAHQIGAEAVSVPAVIFCGEILVGWDSAATTGVQLRQRLDACRARDGRPALSAAPPAPAPGPPLRLPLIGAIDPATLSLPALTLVLASLDAFNPCAFFVLLFLLSMMAHQKSRARMLLIGSIFVSVSGLMYFAFMAAWLSVFQVFGHLAWVTLAAGALALFVGIVNAKDFFAFERGPTLSIPESRKPDIFRRTRAILAADRLPAMVVATTVLAVAANFYELLCTAGFPMVYTRLLTLAEPSPPARFAYLAAYNLVYVLPLAGIVGVFAGTLGARKLSEREGRLLKLLSGVMMLELGALLLLAPDRLSHAGIAIALMAGAVLVTWVAARLTRER